MPDRGSPGMAWNFEENIFRLGIYVNYFGRIYFRNCGPAGGGCSTGHPAHPSGHSKLPAQARTD